MGRNEFFGKVSAGLYIAYKRNSCNMMLSRVCAYSVFEADTMAGCFESTVVDIYM
ncbi:hypothetical protein PC116_g24147 [Phytophthora cactorum]|nr:hypothetical protein Pcac1_g3616 [Phytophthora cactorum]KAG2998585.1 hypothetical protein PC120_g21117 [Phytophthora cactorum]KAG3165976.1 hypothetical protein PC128_g19828 [Phytophthora cactorum]KAG4042950.1 hypothetical protein PC123_g21578 [Phytophthora cactorum]KAG4227469.1 hypothetical protein PC116_g24147 [Phytophthora cactorum]